MPPNLKQSNHFGQSHETNTIQRGNHNSQRKQEKGAKNGVEKLASKSRLASVSLLIGRHNVNEKVCNLQGRGERIKSAYVAPEQLKAFLKGFKRSLTEVTYRLTTIMFRGNSPYICYLLFIYLAIGVWIYSYQKEGKTWVMIALLVVNEGVSGFHLGNNRVIQFSYTYKRFTQFLGMF